MQLLTGAVFNFEGAPRDKIIDGRKVESRWVRFRLGMPKSYKVKKVIDGVERDVREKTFVTCKCFTAQAEIMEQYFSGEENKDRWIQVFGHYEENNYPRTVEVEDPEHEGRILEFEVDRRELEFIVTSFAFVGPAPEGQKPKPKASTSKGNVKVKVKNTDGSTSPTGTTGSGTTAADAMKDLQGTTKTEIEDDLPF